MWRQELAEDQVQKMKEKKMSSEAPDEISVGSFVHMKEDVTTTSYDKMNDEDAEGRNRKWQWGKVPWRRDVQKNWTCPTFTNFHANVHNHAQRQYLKLQKMKQRLVSMSFDGNITQPLCYSC